MKKFISILLLIFCVVLTSCKHEEEKSLYEKELTSFINSYLPEVVTTSFEIPVIIDFSDGKSADIEWASSKESTLKVNLAKEKINYMKNLFDEDVILKAKINVDGAEYECEFKVFVKGTYTFEECIAYINEYLIPNEAYSDIDLVTSDASFFDNIQTATIEYESSDENVLTSLGLYKYTESNDINLKLNYIVKVKDYEFSGSKTILIHGNKNLEYINHASNWLEDNYQNGITIKEDLIFPETDDLGIVSITWESNNLDIIDASGRILNYVVDQEITFTITISLNGDKVTKELKMKTLTKEEAVKYVLDKMHDDTIQQSYFVTYVVSKGRNNSDPGFLNWYVEDVSEEDLILAGTRSDNETFTYGTNKNNQNVDKKSVLSYIIPSSKSYKRPQITRPVNFICIHDTGDSSYNAKQWANECQTSTREVSWHFTVDDKDICQQVPLDEVAYHAGDGSRYFKLNDTGVKYTSANPNITVDAESGYYYINGNKSNLKAPMVDGKYMTSITPAGIYTELGSNGNYYMNDTYYNSTYKLISNYGGNRGSIGIETCIVDNMQYSKVMRNTANLVAHLLDMYNLNTNRVLQHRNFSGKLCPQSMIRAKAGTQFEYSYFRNMYECEYFIIKNLNGAKFTYTCDSNLINSKGEILSYVSTDTKVTYSVKVEFEGKTYTYSYETLIKAM